MKIRRTGQHDERFRLPMTPMIDIVFLLLIFFIFSLKIVLPEGDFNIRMPSAAAARAAEPSELPPWSLVLKAAPSGDLADLLLNGRSFGNRRDAFARLQQYIRSQIDAGGPGAADQEIELDCDYSLHYDYVISALDAVTGYVEGGRRHRLIERVKFTPPERRQ